MISYILQIILMKISSFFVKKISQGELTSDIDMNELLCLFYTKWRIFTEDLPFNKLFVLLCVASAKQNTLTNIKVSKKKILTYISMQLFSSSPPCPSPSDPNAAPGI